MSDVVRWGAFSCALVPVVLLVSGASLVGAAGTTAGLTAVTCVCRALLRKSERTAARVLAENPGRHRNRRGRIRTGAHGGGRYFEGRTPGE
ncbi:hypothetical protein AB0I10_05080 [Streptomyces sp. NPDC050636]|uniref:hypothetical protein n=1 Tax=Streptomyces sp. NPDC050636 TaxID=3154510 RepID=UPI003447C87C